MINSPANIDALLLPLLVDISDQQADDLVADLITTHAESVIKGIIRYKLHLNSSNETQKAEADDLYQDVLLQLLIQLQRFRQDPASYPIADLRGMAAVIAHRSCSRWMRKRFPERHAFKNRLHYLLTRQRGLALWVGEEGKQLAGFALWQSQLKAAPVNSQRLVKDPGLQTQVLAVKNGKQQELAVSLATVFNLLGGPIEFDELVGLMAELLGVRDQTLEPLVVDDDPIRFEPVATERDQAWKLEKRVFLERLWDELKQLPVNQRTALLLNLKDANGNGCITLLPVTGVASLREIANALELTPEKFAELWNDLPLEDARIAELVGVTRQQVINARKSGRERLARRLKGFV